MKVNLSVKSDQLSKEDLRALLQAIRDCEKATFPDKEIYVSAEAPELSTDEMTEILTSIKPPYDYGPVIFKYAEEQEKGEAKGYKNMRPKRFALHWPHFIVVVKDTIVGSGDNLKLTFKHALSKEVEMLRLADKIELVRRWY